jgi:hypothetical protein
LILIFIYFDILYLLMLGILIGISRPKLNPTGWYCGQGCTDGWFIDAYLLTLGASGATSTNRAIALACSWTLATTRFASSKMARITAQATQQAA